MRLLPAHRLRRWLQAAFIAVMALLVLAPMLTQALRRQPAAAVENRPLATWPGWPGVDIAPGQWPGRIDAWLGDNFGLRSLLVLGAHKLRYALFGEFVSHQIVAGRNGRLFLGAHNTAEPYSLIQVPCGWGVTEDQRAGIADRIATLLTRMQAEGLAVDLLLVPSAAVLYPQDLPGWLARQCAASQRTAPLVEAALPPPLRARYHDAFAPMTTPGLPQLPIPRINFHWAGIGADLTERWLAEQRLGLREVQPLPVLQQRMPSDINQFFPGVWLQETVQQADPAAAGIESCKGRLCFPELGPAAATVADMSRYRGPQAGAGRLLLLTDSFGIYGAAYFARHFGEVRHFSTNHIEHLDAAGLQRFRQVALEDYRPDRVVLLYHDWAMVYFPDKLMRLLFPAQAGVLASQSGKEAR